MTNYKRWRRAKLIQHIEAYGESLHTLANIVMKQEHELRRLRPLQERFRTLESLRDRMHGVR